MSSIPHLSNAMHSRHLRQAVEQEQSRGGPRQSASAGALHSLTDALKSVKVPIGIELSDKFISVNNKSIASCVSSFFTNRN